MSLQLSREEAYLLTKLQTKNISIKEIDNLFKLKELHQKHSDNPTYVKKDLVSPGFTMSLVRQYWDMFVEPRPVYVLRDWTQVLTEEMDELK